MRYSTIIMSTLVLLTSACGGGGGATATPDAMDAYKGRWSHCDAAASRLTAWNIEKTGATSGRITIEVGSMSGPVCSGPAWEKTTVLEGTLSLAGKKDYAGASWDQVEITSGSTARKELMAASANEIRSSFRIDGTSQGGATDAQGYPDSFSFYRIARSP